MAELISEQQQALINLSDSVSRHNQSNMNANGWTDPSTVARRMGDLNKQKSNIETKEKELQEKNKQILEIASKDNPDEADKAKLQTLVQQRDELIDGKLIPKIDKDGKPELDEKGNIVYVYDGSGIEDLKDNFDKDYQEANEYLRVSTNKDGKIVAKFTDNEHTDAKGLWLTKQISGPQDLPTSGSFHPDQKFMYTSAAGESIQRIISVFQSGEEEQLTDEDFQILFREGYNVTGDAYNVLQQNIIDTKFRYNIKRNFNEKLNDIRNIKNFRASNITNTSEEGGSRLDVRTGDFMNPVTVDGSNASKSFYMSRNDFYWSQNYNDISNENGTTERQSVPSIILNEYQPTLQYNIGAQVLTKVDSVAGGTVKDTAGAILDKLGMGGMTDFAGLLAQHGVEKLYNDKISEIGANPQSLYAEEHYEDKTNPMYYVEHLFNNGTWLGTYELPFISDGQIKTDYLQNGTQPGQWDVGGLADTLTGENSLAQMIQHKRISLSLPASPIFTIGDAHKSSFPSFSISFYLINKDDQYLDKNFQFMQSIFAGTSWVAMTFGAVVATNVYHVLVPGRFQIHWAYMTSNFQAMGKLRTNKYMYATHGQTIRMIEVDTLWPEAWHVTLEIHPLTPWNFNTHMAYYLNGFGAAQRNRLATMKTAWWNTGVSLQVQANQIEEAKKRKSAMVTKINEIEKTIMKDLDEMDELFKKGKMDSDKYRALQEEVIKKRNQMYRYYDSVKLFEQQYIDAMVEAGLGTRTELQSQRDSEAFTLRMEKNHTIDKTIASRISNANMSVSKGSSSAVVNRKDELKQMRKNVTTLWRNGMITEDEARQKIKAIDVKAAEFGWSRQDTM